MPEIIIPDTDALPQAAVAFLRLLPPGARVIDFDGPMGAGKTTFISALCRALGAEDEATSPTFSIINEYPLRAPARPGSVPALHSGAGPSVIYHFDFYRLDSPEQALEIGAEDYLYSGQFCFLEWASNVAPILPEETLKVTINPQPDGSRIIRF